MVGASCILLLRQRRPAQPTIAAARPPLKLVGPAPTKQPALRQSARISTMQLGSSPSNASLTASAPVGGNGTSLVASTARAAPSPVHVLTFADRPTVYLDALAHSVCFFNEGRPLHVLGLSGSRSPATDGRWRRPAGSISGTDPGKLKKARTQELAHRSSYAGEHTHQTTTHTKRPHAPGDRTHQEIAHARELARTRARTHYESSHARELAHARWKLARTSSTRAPCNPRSAPLCL